MKLIKSFLLLLGVMMAFSPLSMALDHTRPQMLGDKFYKEYWEQYFLFDDGTFVTSQFLVANMPWPVGKEHGIMIATIIRPDGKHFIIKNGRSLGGWGFDPEKFNIFIYNHRLGRDGEKDVVHLGTVGRDVVDVSGKSAIAPLDHHRLVTKKGYMDSSFYLPFFEGDGSWKIKWNKKQPQETGAGKVQGFAAHVVITAPVDKLVDNWLRVSGLSNGDNQPIPLLSSIQQPDGARDIVFVLKNPNGEITRFSSVTLEYKDIKKGGKKSSYPTVFEIKANNETEKLTGTIRFSRKIDHYNINDHLNFFERSFSRSRASAISYRYIADYEMTYTTPGGTQKLTGKALSEYQDVFPPARKKKSRRRRRR